MNQEVIDLMNQLTAAKGEIEKLNNEGRWAENVRIRKRLTDAKVEIEELKATHINQSDVNNRQYAELTAAKVEIEKLRERWNKASDLAGHNLDERESLIKQLRRK